MPTDESPLDGQVAESQLLERLRAREPAAFEQLVRQYSGRLLAVARRFLNNEEDARDAVQDAFLSAFRSVDRFEGSAQLGTWLHRIVVNASLMKLRRRQRKPERSIEDLLPKFQADGHHADPVVAWGPSPGEMLQTEETRRQVREAIDRLPENYRTVLLLRDIEGVDNDETARLLGETVAAVKTRLHRARLALREILDPLVRGGES
jgi:RNA polymerase sigma-70 factor (ECF subfamily)